MIEKVEVEKCAAHWKDTNDPMLVDLALYTETEGKLPSEEELTDILTFYLVFSMGCREMKLEQEAENFNNRANALVGGLERANIKGGKYYSYMKKCAVDGVLNRIKNIASSRATYSMLDDSRRESKVKK
jgi:hypothetical protein